MKKRTDSRRNERPLPQPPKTPFGRPKPEQAAEEPGSLIADRMAVAAAEGKLDEFLKKEMPDNEYARNLASMMMGMTGILSSPSVTAPAPPDNAAESVNEEPGIMAQGVPEALKKAVRDGDVNELMGLLRREHRKRSGEERAPAEDKASHTLSVANQSTIDKEIIDALILIAQENNVTLDWMILRAIKVYVQEYRQTGKL